MLWPNGSKARPPIASTFGPRRAPVAGASTFHRGTDFTGFSLNRAVAAGTVVAVGTPSGWAGGGIQAWVQHDGFLARYLHMKSAPIVHVGQSVAEGQILGVMGMTGTASGVHLHLEIVVNGVQIDPVPFITARLATTAGGKTTDPIRIREDIDVRFIKAALDGTTHFALITLGKGQETTTVTQANLWAQTFGDAKVVTEAAYKEALYNVARL